jgi:hypothetical protein
VRTTSYIRKDPFIKWILQYKTVGEAWIHANEEQRLVIFSQAPELFLGVRGDSHLPNILDVVKERVKNKDLSGVFLKPSA